MDLELVVDFWKVDQQDWIRLDRVERSGSNSFEDYGDAIVIDDSLEVSVLQPALCQGSSHSMPMTTGQEEGQEQDFHGY